MYQSADRTAVQLAQEQNRRGNSQNYEPQGYHFIPPLLQCRISISIPGALSIYEPGGDRSFEERNGSGYNQGFPIVGMHAVNRWAVGTMAVGIRTTACSTPVPEVLRPSHAAVVEMGLLVLVYTLKTVVFFRWLFRSSHER